MESRGKYLPYVLFYFISLQYFIFIFRIVQSTPSKFFTLLERVDKANLCKWVGELYLELHRGTYTSQAKVKTIRIVILVVVI